MRDFTCRGARKKTLCCCFWTLAREASASFEVDILNLVSVSGYPLKQRLAQPPPLFGSCPKPVEVSWEAAVMAYATPMQAVWVFLPGEAGSPLFGWIADAAS